LRDIAHGNPPCWYEDKERVRTAIIPSSRNRENPGGRLRLGRHGGRLAGHLHSATHGNATERKYNPGKNLMRFVGWAVGALASAAMAIAVNLTPTYLLALGGFTFPGYTTLNSVILNLFVAIVLTPAFNATHPRRAPLDVATTADYHV
jgi:hypothetical protein